MICSGISPPLTNPLQLSSDNSTLFFRTTEGNCRIHLLQSQLQYTQTTTHQCSTLLLATCFYTFMDSFAVLNHEYSFCNKHAHHTWPWQQVHGPLQSSSKERGKKPIDITAQEWHCRERQLNLLSLLCLETGSPSHSVKSSPGSILQQQCWVIYFIELLRDSYKTSSKQPNAKVNTGCC